MWYSAGMNEDTSFQTPPLSEQLLADELSPTYALAAPSKQGGVAPAGPSTAAMVSVFAFTALAGYLGVKALRG